MLAAALLVVGAGLLVGTWFGRARWLLAVGLLLVLALAATAAAERAGLQEGVGAREWRPDGSSSYRHGAGEAVLDLQRLEPGEQAEIDARVGVGELVVLLPPDVGVRVTAQVGVGAIWERGPDGQRSQLTGDGRPGDGDGDSTDVRAVLELADRDGETPVDVDLEVGLGEIEVQRVAP